MIPKHRFFASVAAVVVCGVLAAAQAGPAPHTRATAAAASGAGQSAERSQRATNVIGSQVYGRAGHERIGQIEDLVIDRGGRVSLAVLTLRPNVLSPAEPKPGSRSTGPATADRLYAVPWSALRYDGPMQHFVLDAAADELASAPSFLRTTWPDMSDERWGQSVYRHYGRRYETAASAADSGRKR